ncbi:MAG: ion transporter [Desulfovibrio sp.]|nr:MAG: ion transporter [Desulfovibrio sp.]
MPDSWDPQDEEIKHMPFPGLRGRTHEIIFGAETPMGKLFDVGLIASIILSVFVVCLDSVPSINARFGGGLLIIEWVLTIMFTLEYLVRLFCVTRPWDYARSFYGIVDLLAILPTYASLFVPGAQYLLVIRVLRILRIFRVLKLVQYMGEAQALARALRASARKIAVFLYFVLTLVIVFGSLVYIVEGEENGFSSIPKAIYWAIVTLTTVGYGDISPQTGLGQALAAIIMVMGYGIIAVPTGIVTVEMSKFAASEQPRCVCSGCAHPDHDPDADFCKYCGKELETETATSTETSTD